MLVFGSKLFSSSLSKDDSNDGDMSSTEAQKSALSSLSRQEKLLIVELQRTRANIVTELSRLDPSISADSWLDVQQTIAGYQTKIARIATEDTVDGKKRVVPYLPGNQFFESGGVRNGGGTSKGLSLTSTSKYLSASTPARTSSVASAARIPLSRIRTGIDMLPILASTGESAFEVGLRKQGELRLPVFKLPAIDPVRVAALLEDPNSKVSRNVVKEAPLVLRTAESTKSKRTSARFTSALAYLEYLLQTTRTMPWEDLSKMKKMLSLGEQDVVAVEEELDARVRRGKMSPQELAEHEMREKNSASLFMQVRISVDDLNVKKVDVATARQNGMTNHGSSAFFESHNNSASGGRLGMGMASSLGRGSGSGSSNNKHAQRLFSQSMDAGGGGQGGSSSSSVSSHKGSSRSDKDKGMGGSSSGGTRSSMDVT